MAIVVELDFARFDLHQAVLEFSHGDGHNGFIPVVAPRVEDIFAHQLNGDELFFEFSVFGDDALDANLPARALIFDEEANDCPSGLEVIDSEPDEICVGQFCGASARGAHAFSPVCFGCITA